MKNGKGFFLVLLLILLTSLLLRTWAIETRPLHSDEGVNFHFIEETQKKGYYPYSHENYHGPSFFYLTQFGISVFGESIFGLRAATIILGLLIPLLLLLLQRTQGSSFILISTLLIALSPSLVFYARYAIHETLLVFATTWFALSIYLWGTEHKRWQIYSAATALSLLICTKETFIIAGFAIFIALLSLRNPKEQIEKVKEQLQDIILSLLVCFILTSAIYTALFRWTDGLHQLALTIPQWIGRSSSDTGHHKAFDYYLNMLFQTELHLLLAPLTIFFIKNSFVRFTLLWTLLSFFIYSWVPYKTPWLIINISLPAILLVAWLTNQAIQKTKLSLILLIALTAYSTVQTVKYNFEPYKPYGPGNPYSYVHTSPGFLEFLDDIKAYWQKEPKARLLVGVNAYWPIPFYLKEKASLLGYLKTDDVEKYKDEYQVLVVNYTVNWNKPGWEKKYYRLSDVQEANVYFKKP